MRIEMSDKRDCSSRCLESIADSAGRREADGTGTLMEAKS